MIVGKFSGGYVKAWYGKRPIIDVDVLPEFKNIGWNHSIAVNPDFRIIRIDNMGLAERTADNYSEFQNRWQDWVTLRDGEGETEMVFLSPSSDDYIKSLHEYKGIVFDVTG